jgi:hypothetical protein
VIEVLNINFEDKQCISEKAKAATSALLKEMKALGEPLKRVFRTLLNNFTGAKLRIFFEKKFSTT